MAPLAHNVSTKKPPPSIFWLGVWLSISTSVLKYRLGKLIGWPSKVSVYYLKTHILWYWNTAMCLYIVGSITRRNRALRNKLRLSQWKSCSVSCCSKCYLCPLLKWKILKLRDIVAWDWKLHSINLCVNRSAGCPSASISTLLCWRAEPWPERQPSGVRDLLYGN